MELLKQVLSLGEVYGFSKRARDNVKEETDYVGGVPEDLFVLTNKRVEVFATGRSGRNLTVVTSPTRYEIRDTYHPHFYYIVFSYEQARKTLIPALYTTFFENGTPKKHPDLYAAQIMRRVFDLFDKKYGEIYAIQSSWLPETNPALSVNYSSFHEYMAKEESKPDFMYLTEREKAEELSRIKAEAAKQTWTGQLAGSLGYTEVKFEHENNTNGIFCQFIKPNN